MKKIELADSRGAIELAYVRNIAYLFVFFLSLYLYINCPKDADLHLHIRFIEKIDQGRLVVPHFLYHLVVFTVSKVSHLSFHYASCLVLASCIVASMILIERILRNFLRGRYSDYFVLFVSLSLIFVSAIYFPLINKYPYKGIWSPNPWHNPTYIAAKPFVLLSFYWYTLEITKKACFEKRFSVIRISLLLVICTLIKPNYVLAFIPASILFCFFQSDKIRMFLKTVQLLLPVLIVLLLQYLFTYYYDVKGSSSIQFCFFDVWQGHAKSLFLAILQATAFPLVAFIVMRPRLSGDKMFFFSWVLFIVGLFIFGFLCETGHRRGHANFAWTYMFCLNILFIYSTIVFLRWISDIPKDNRAFQIKLFLCSMTFLIHFFSGIYYVGYLMSGRCY